MKSLRTFENKESKLVKYAIEFDKDLERLHPLSKLKGIGANKESRSRLPNLEKTTEAYAEDLVMAIEEILEPIDEVIINPSWRKSNI